MHSSPHVLQGYSAPFQLSNGDGKPIFFRHEIRLARLIDKACHNVEKTFKYILFEGEEDGIAMMASSICLFQANHNERLLAAV